MAVQIDPSDVAMFVPEADPDKVQALIVGALARAALVAPCILTDDFAYDDAARAIVVEAVVRRLEAGAGSLAMQQAGPFQQAIDTRTSPRVLFWPGEVVELQRLCEESKAIQGTTVPRGSFPKHLPERRPVTLAEYDRREVYPTAVNWPDPPSTTWPH